MLAHSFATGLPLCYTTYYQRQCVFTNWWNKSHRGDFSSIVSSWLISKMTPKAEIKQEKKEYVNELAEQFKSASSTVFIDYTGMGVVAQQELKNLLRDSGGKMFVAKNTLIQLAAEKAEFPSDSVSDEVLAGQTAVVVATEDAVAPIQVLGKFSSEKDAAKMKGGIVEGIFQSADGLTKISKLPGKDQLYAQVVGGIAAPMYGLVGTLQGNLNKLVWILKAKVDKDQSNT